MQSFPASNCQYYCESLFEWQLTSCLLPGPVHFDIQPFESAVWLELKFFSFLSCFSTLLTFPWRSRQTKFMLGESYEFTIILLLFVVTLRISPLEEKIILTANFNVTPAGQFLLLFPPVVYYFSPCIDTAEGIHLQNWFHTFPSKWNKKFQIQICT